MAEVSHISSDWFIGEDKQFPFTIYQKDENGNFVKDGSGNLVPQDISGWSLEWKMRRSDSSADPAVLSKTTPSGITITSGPLGEGYVSINSSDTDGLPAFAYRHAIKRTDSGSETVLFYGNAILGKRTTR